MTTSEDGRHSASARSASVAAEPSEKRATRPVSSAAASTSDRGAPVTPVYATFPPPRSMLVASRPGVMSPGAASARLTSFCQPAIRAWVPSGTTWKAGSSLL